MQSGTRPHLYSSRLRAWRQAARRVSPRFMCAARETFQVKQAHMIRAIIKGGARWSAAAVPAP